MIPLKIETIHVSFDTIEKLFGQTEAVKPSDMFFDTFSICMKTKDLFSKR